MATSKRSSRIIQWHRLAGISFTDTFTGILDVTQEIDLGQVAQRLDLAAVRRSPGLPSDGAIEELPDGLQNIAEHNLVTFKSNQESLTEVDVRELIGYSVAYAKQIWRKQWKPPLAEGRIRLFAITVQHPQWLTSAEPSGVRPVRPGVFDVPLLSDSVRLIVPRETELIPRNSLWHLLSGERERVRYGLEHYRTRDDSLYNALRQYCFIYGWEGFAMPYTKEDFIREQTERILAETPREKILAKITNEQLLDGLPEERLESLRLELERRMATKSNVTASPARKRRKPRSS